MAKDYKREELVRVAPPDGEETLLFCVAEDTPSDAGSVKMFPQGGGFRYDIPVEHIVERGVRISSAVERMTVSAGEGPTVRAWVGEARWNGWLMPYVEPQDMAAYISRVAALLSDGEEGWTQYQLRGRELYELVDVDGTGDPDAPHEWMVCARLETIGTPEGEREVFNVGGSLCWEEDERNEQEG